MRGTRNFLKGKALFKERDYSGAIIALLGATSKGYLDDVEANEMLIRSYFYNQDYDRAIKRALYLFNIEEDNPIAFRVIQDAYIAKKEYEKAMHYAEKEKKAFPDDKIIDMNIYIYKIKKYLDQKDHVNAMELYQEAMDLFPEGYQIAEELSLQFLEDGDYYEANSFMYQAIKRAPQSAELWSYLAYSYRLMGQSTIALDLLVKKANELDPGSDLVDSYYQKLILDIVLKSIQGKKYKPLHYLLRYRNDVQASTLQYLKNLEKHKKVNKKQMDNILEEIVSIEREKLNELNINAKKILGRPLFTKLSMDGKRIGGLFDDL